MIKTEKIELDELLNFIGWTDEDGPSCREFLLRLLNHPDFFKHYWLEGSEGNGDPFEINIYRIEGVFK